MQQSLARIILGSAALITGLAVAAPPAAAQQADRGDERWHPEWGDWSLSFHLPSGGGAGFGFWKQRGRDVALGLTVDGTLAFSDRENPDGDVSSSEVAFSVGPALKRYWWRDGPVSPFFHTGLSATYRRAEVGATSSWRFGGGLTVGLGADWFPVQGISLGGHTGLGASYLWATDNDDVPGDQSLLVIDLFTSALTVHFYF
ncbi:MAG: hypothetical protein KY466_01090 [Gemmatimonadetes bacterium]|nr:hypothetical protein [Gemmatimonadota bacterium]